MTNITPNQVGTTKSLDFSAIAAQLNFLRGKVLTVIDAVLPEGTQNKSAKDLIHQQFNEQADWICQLCGGNPHATLSVPHNMRDEEIPL